MADFSFSDWVKKKKQSQQSGGGQTAPSLSAPSTPQSRTTAPAAGDGFSFSDWVTKKRSQELRESILSGNTPETNEAYNSWMDSLSSFSERTSTDFKGRENRYQSLDALDEYRSSTGTDISSMLSQASSYSSYFNRYKGLYDELYGEGTADSILESIAQGTEYLKSTRSNLDSEYDYWSQWETEDDYNSYLEQVKEYERLSGYDVAGGKSSLAVLEAQAEEAKKKRNTAQALLTGYSYGGIGMGAELEKAASDYSAYSSQYNDLKSQISALQRELKQAEDIQTANRYTAYLNEPDFSSYSSQGASIANPSINDVEKGVTIFGWNPFGEKPGNIVTYSRDNWEYIAMGEANNSQMTGRSLYHWMTDDEVNVYNFLLAKSGEEAAQEYLDHLEETLNYRFGTMQAENIQDIGGVGEAFITGLYSLGSGMDRFASGARQLLSSEGLPTTATQYASSALREDLSGVGGVLYDIGGAIGNMAPSILLSALTGGLGAPAAVSAGVGAATLGASAGGNAYNQGLADGYTQEQARTYGALIGASEGALQYALGGISALGGVSGKIASKVAAIDSAAARVALTFGGKMASEGIEEGLQEILDPVFRTIIFDEELDINFEDAAYAAMLGALTAGVLEGPGLIINGVPGQPGTQMATLEFGAETDGYLGADGIDYFEGIDNIDALQRAYRDLAKQNHPDVGGAEQTMSNINRQYAMKKAFYSAQQAAQGASSDVIYGQPPAQSTDIAEQLVNEGVNETRAETLANSIQSIIRGEDISGNAAAAIAQSKEAVSVLSALTGTTINTDAPISEVKTAIRNLASRTRAANSTGGGTDTSGANEAQERIRRGYASKGERTVAVQAFDTERIGEIADTLGKAGAKALTSMYDATTQDAESYFEGMTVYYNAGKNGAKLSSVKDGGTLTQAQKQAAYLAGQSDAQSSVSLAQDDKSGYTVDTNKTSETEDATNGGKEIHLRTGGERSDGTGAGGTVRAMAEGTGGNQVGQAQGRPADGGTASLTYGEKVSTASFGIANGSASKTVRRVTGGTTEAIKKAKALAKKRGLRLELFAGDNLTIGGKSVRACIIGDRVFARVDHPDFDADQLVRHEVGHDMIDKGEIDPDTIRDRLADTFTESQLDTIAELYASAYTGMTAQQAWIELICDSLADMNIFSGTVLEGELGPILGEAKRKATAELGEKSPRGPPEEKTSRDPDARRRALQRGEMQNRFKGKVNWPAYYEKLNRPEYRTDNFDDGAITYMPLGGMRLTLEMQSNGEFSVIGIYNIKEGTYDTGLESGKEANTGNRKGAEILRTDEGHAGRLRGDVEGQGRGGAGAVSDTGGGDGGKSRNQADATAPQQADSGAGGELKASREVDEKRLVLAEMNAKYSALEKQSKEFESKPEYKQFVESIGKLKGDALDAAIEKYDAWERESGYAAVSKEMEELRGDIKDLRSDIERTEEREAKEAREAYRATYTEELAKKYASKAARKFGTTSRFNLAGYLTVNGSLLDFSDRQGYRVQDHREIADVLDFLPKEHGYSDGLIEFMNMGNIRLQSYGIDISKAPNKAQIPVLQRFFDSLGGEATIDFSNENGDSMGSVDYPEGTRSNRIIREINNYFETGIVPTVSDMQRFHYSEDVESLRDLREQNEALQDKVDYWKGQLKRTEPGAQTLRENDIDKLAKSVLKGYGSELKPADIRAGLKSLGEYILRGGDGENELTYSEVKDRAVAIARDIVQNAYELVNNDEAETYRDIKAYFRGTYLSFEDKGDIADWADFRKRNFGRFTISKSGLPVDVAYQELTGMFGESYFPSEITHPTDQLLHIADLFDSMRPVYENPHSYYMAEAIEYCANEIIDGLISEDVRQTPPTFADRQAAKLGEQKAKDRQKLNDLREQKNDRIEEIKAAGRERAKQAVGKERARRLEQVSSLKEHYRTKEEKARQSRRASALRNKIMRHVKELSTKLLRPTDKQHIPESLRGPVSSLLNAVNLESQYTIDPDTGARISGGDGNPTKRTEAFNALRKLYREIEEGRGDYSLVIDPDLMDNLDDVISMRDVRLADMNMTQLDLVWQTIRAIEASVTSANKMLGQSRFETISGMAEALQEDNADFKTKQNRAGFVGGLEKFLSIEMLKPVDYMHRLGRAGDALWAELRGAQDAYIRRISQVEADMKAVIGDTKINDWGGKKAKVTTFTTENGDSIDFTPAQVMELYLLIQRPQALGHILKGGIRQATVVRKGGKLSEGSAPARVTLGDLAKITGTLTAEQTRIADEIGKYASGALSDWGNEASMTVYGYKKFTEERYWPIKSDPSYTKSESGKGVDVTIKGRGFTKQTVQHASNAIMINDAFDTFAQHVNDMATYSSWLAAIEDAERLKNFRYRNAEGETVGSVKETINRVLGSAGTEYLDLLIEDINQGVKRRIDSFTLNWMTSNYKAAAVGANMRVIIQQPTAILRAAAIIDPKYLAAGTLRKGKWALVKKWAPIAQWKDWGYFELDNGRLIKDIVLGTDSGLDQLRQKAMEPAGLADSITWGKIWNAAEAEISDKRPELTKGSNAYYEAVAARFNEIIDRSQVVDGILQRNQAMRSASDLMRMATSFMSEPITSYSMLSSALYDTTHAHSDEARAKAKKRLARTVLAVLLADILCAAVASLVDAIRDDDKDQTYWQKWAEAFTGISGDEESFSDYFAAILSGNVGDQINLFAKIPFAKDVFSLLQGYSIERMDMVSVSKLTQSVQRTLKALDGRGKATVGAALADLFANVARLFGLPVYNMKRDISGIANTALSAIGNWQAMYEADKLLYSIGSSDNKGRYYDIAFYAWQEEDRSQYDAICADMIKHGYTQKDIDNAIRTRLKKTESFTDSADTVRESIAGDLEQSRGFKSLPSDYQTKALEAAGDYATATTMLEQNDDYALPSTYSWIEKADAGASVGVEPWEYILFRVALQMADDDGSLKQDEVIDALEEMTWLTDRERDYLFGTRYSSDKNNPWAR